MQRWMYVGENLDPDSHTQEFLDSLKRECDFFIPRCLGDDYEDFGLSGLQDFYEMLLSENKINVLWVSPGDSCRVDPRWLYKLRHNSPHLKIISCFSDSEHLFDCNDKFFAQTSDISLVHGVSNIPRFHMLNLNAVGGQIFDFELYEKFRCDEKNTAISFIGGVFRSNRQSFFKTLEDHEIEVRVAGFGSSEGWVSREAALELVAKSRVHLNFSGVGSSYHKIDTRMNQFKGRIFETILVGTIPITQYDSSSELMFGEYYSLLNVFHDEKELLERIKDVFDDFPKHENNVEILRRFIIERYNPSDIITKIIDDDYKFDVQPTCFIDSVFGERFIQTRFFYLGKFLINLELDKTWGELSSIIHQIRYLNWGCLRNLCRGFWHGIRLIL